MSDETDIEWSVPGSSSRTNRVKRCLELAATCARDFNTSFDIRSEERECSVPQFDPDELVLSEEPVRIAGFYREYMLHEAAMISDCVENGAFGEAKKAKSRFASRSNEGFYSVKFLQEGIVEQDHAMNATTEMILEVKILMSLASHPHVAKIYGITAAGIASLVQSGRSGYFFITDRIPETLVERMDAWRQDTAYTRGESSEITQRLEIALDIASALVFLHDRKLVFYMRPDKVGFDARQGIVKLFSFGQARQQGMESHPRSVTQSDNMRSLAYTAPEVFCMAAAHTGSDVFAFGVLLWEMMSLEHAFKGYDRAMHFEQVVRLNHRPLDIDSHWDPEIAEMVQSCWQPHKRPTMKRVHSTLETRLLFQEPSNEIQDTARILKRRHSEGLVKNLMDETQNVSSPSKDVLHQLDGTVLPLHTTERELESDEAEKTEEAVGDEKKAPSGAQLNAVENEQVDEADMTAENPAGEADFERSVSSLQLSMRDLHSNTQNASATSFQSSMQLEEVLRQIVSSLTDAPRRSDSNASKSTRSSASKSSSVSKSSSEQGSKEKRRSRTKTQTRRRSRNTLENSVSKLTDNPDKISAQAPRTMGDASSSTLSSGEHDDVAHVDGEEDVIASLMSRSEQDAEQISPSSMAATYDMSPKPKKAPILDTGSAVDPAPRPRRSLIIRGRRASSNTPNQSSQRLRRRSKSREPPERRKTLSLADLGDLVSSEEQRMHASPTRRIRVKVNSQTAVSHLESRMSMQRSASHNSGQRESALPLSSQESAQSTKPDESFGVRRSRRASLAEVKSSFDFEPDPPKRTASNDVIKNLQEAVENATPIQTMPECPQSPTKQMATAGKRMLGGILRLGSGRERIKDPSLPDSPKPTPRQGMRRSSLVLDIVGQQKSFRAANGNNTSDDKADAAPVKKSSRSAWNFTECKILQL